MRVLQVITSLLTGGAEHIVVQLAENLTVRGIHCDICVFDGEDTPFMREVEAWNGAHGGCEPIHIYKLGHGFYNPLYIPRLVRLMRHYDIVHTHNSSPQLFAVVARALCFNRKPILCTTEHNTSNRKRKHRSFRPIDRWTYSQYRAIVCISGVAEERLRSYLGGRWCSKTSDYYKLIKTVCNGVDVDKFHSVEPSAELTASKSGRKAIVMVARFRKQKDQDTLVRAMTHLDKGKYEVWLVGVGERMEEVRQLASNLGIKGNVRFLGLRTDVPNVLRAADIIVMSSHWEGLSLSNVEGMAAGKPFIASRANGLREVTEGYGIMFKEGDDEELARIIERVCGDDGLYQYVAVRCYRRASQYDIGKMIDGYEAIYKSLAKK